MRSSHASLVQPGCILALAIGLCALAPGSSRAQYLDGAWAYSDLGAGYGGFQGFEFPGYAAPGYGFEVPGFADVGMAPFSSFGSNPYFDMGTSVPGVEREVAEVSGYLGTQGYSGDEGPRVHYRPRVKVKAKSKKAAK
jgi:hypothetical protein